MSDTSPRPDRSAIASIDASLIPQPRYGFSIRNAGIERRGSRVAWSYCGAKPSANRIDRGIAGKRRPCSHPISAVSPMRCFGLRDL